MFGRRKKRKFTEVTLQDLKDKFDKDGQYGYVLVDYNTGVPIWLCKSRKEAMMQLEECWNYGYRHCEIVDFLFL